MEKIDLFGLLHECEQLLIKVFKIYACNPNPDLLSDIRQCLNIIFAELNVFLGIGLQYCDKKLILCLKEILQDIIEDEEANK